MKKTNDEELILEAISKVFDNPDKSYLEHLNESGPQGEKLYQTIMRSALSIGGAAISFAFPVTGMTMCVVATLDLLGIPILDKSVSATSSIYRKIKDAIHEAKNRPKKIRINARKLQKENRSVALLKQIQLKMYERQKNGLERDEANQEKLAINEQRAKNIQECYAFLKSKYPEFAEMPVAD